MYVMNKNTKFFLVVLLVLILIVVGYRYKQYYLDRNFLIEVNTVCDIESENCFVADCSIEEDPDCDDTPYKKVKILANEAPACLEEHTCEVFSCEEKENCSVIYCSDESLEDGERCF